MAAVSGRSLMRLLGALILLSRLADCDDCPLPAPSCGQVFNDLVSCLGYLKGTGSQPSAACCSGIKSISNQVKTTDDREAVCSCIKQGLSMAGKYDPSLIPQLPKECGVSITLPPIDQNTDCSKALAYVIG